MVKDFALIFGDSNDCIFFFGLQRRASRMRRHYYYTAITSTPFTLVVSLPDKYGASKVHGVEEIRRSLAEGEILNFNEIFTFLPPQDIFIFLYKFLGFRALK
jgi:hypothetical protein